MAKTYHIARIHESTLQSHSTAKAFYSVVASGRMGRETSNNMVWFAKSVCKFSEPNEVGYVTVYIPAWLLNKARPTTMQMNEFKARLSDLVWPSNGEAQTIQM